MWHAFCAVHLSLLHLSSLHLSSLHLSSLLLSLLHLSLLYLSPLHLSSLFLCSLFLRCIFVVDKLLPWIWLILSLNLSTIKEHFAHRGLKGLVKLSHVQIDSSIFRWLEKYSGGLESAIERITLYNTAGCTTHSPCLPASPSPFSSQPGQHCRVSQNQVESTLKYEKLHWSYPIVPSNISWILVHHSAYIYVHSSSKLVANVSNQSSSARQYVGNPIDCVHTKDIPEVSLQSHVLTFWIEIKTCRCASISWFEVVNEILL